MAALWYAYMDGILISMNTRSRRVPAPKLIAFWCGLAIAGGLSAGLPLRIQQLVFSTALPRRLATGNGSQHISGSAPTTDFSAMEGFHTQITSRVAFIFAIAGSKRKIFVPGGSVDSDSFSDVEVRGKKRKSCGKQQYRDYHLENTVKSDKY